MPGHRAGADLAPAHPHLRPDLRLPPAAPGRRHVPGGRLRRRARRAGVDLAAGLRQSGPASRCCSSRAPSGTTRSPPTCSAASSRSPPGRASTSSSPQRIFGPLGMTDTGFCAQPDDLGRLAALYAPRPVNGKAGRIDAMGDGGPQAADDAQRRRRPGLHRGRLPPVHCRCCCPARTARPASSTACGCSARAPSPTWPATTCQAAGPGDVRPPAERRVAAARRRLRPRLRGRPRPGRRQGTSAREGELSWGGAASTAFWIDPAEELTVASSPSCIPSSAHPHPLAAAPARLPGAAVGAGGPGYATRHPLRPGGHRRELGRQRRHPDARPGGHVQVPVATARTAP